MPLRNWTKLEVEATLIQAGLVRPGDVLELVEGESRIAARLPNDRIAWFPTSIEGRRLLIMERRVLRLLEQYCRFSAPRVIHEDESGWDLRKAVPGTVRPTGLLERLRRDPAFAHLFGEDLGRILADQHTQVPEQELDGWLSSVPDWPRAEDVARLPKVIRDANLLERINLALKLRSTIRDDRPVLVHADLGLHNIVVHPESLRVAGVFDYEGAVFGDRHLDFAYLVFQRHEEPMLEGAISTYEPATGMKIDRDRVHLLNAVAAIGFLGFRYGHPPEEPWCGRTLEQDLAWTDAALAAAGL